MPSQLRDQVTALLNDIRRQHDDALVTTNRIDPDWPIWFADRLVDPLSDLLGHSLSRSQLIHCLINADCDHQARSPDSAWSQCCAEHLISCYASSQLPTADKLALYHFEGCPFCSLARAAIERSGIAVELRDIFQHSQYRGELIEARGRATVPVLRITSPDGAQRWMPESRDIAQYIIDTYG